MTNSNPLAKKIATVKTGEEKMISNGIKLKYNLLDFWRWSVSDLLSNATRGRFAEYIVATAIGVDTQQVREEWAAFDLITPDGIKIEVKSAAYLQSWAQRSLSKISFSIKHALPWDEETGKYLTTPGRSADVYVFCLLHHNDKDTCDPLNMDHWEFYVLATSMLHDDRSSISLKSLRMLTEAVDYNGVKSKILEKNLKKNKINN